MIRSIAIASLMAFAAPEARSETPPLILALKGLDPVSLAAGQETPGLESLEATFGRFKYRFATAANRKAFLAKPEAHAIQFGGACGKMGPFSGSGNAERYFIHDKRIYIFASDFCRDAFKKSPESYIERPNAAPVGTEEEKREGAKRVARALEGFGGAAAVDGLKTMSRVESITYRQGGKETVGSGRATWVFPDSVRVEEDYGTAYGHVLKGNAGFELYGKMSWPLEPALRDDAWRRALREPLMMLRNRGVKGFVAVARGDDRVEVSLDGATSLWTLDAKTGRIVKAEYKSRRATVGDTSVVYSDFKTVKGLVLPHARAVSFNGKAIVVPETRLEKLDVNPDVKPELFLQPK